MDLLLRSCLNFFQKYYLHCPQEVLVFLCPFFACFSLFRSYIARYVPLKKEKNILKKFYKNFKDINLNSF